MALPCQILAQSSCCGINFRIYLGDIEGKTVDVAVRHLSESEVRYGLGYIASAYWLKIVVMNVISDQQHLVLINKNSFIKRLIGVGVSRKIIDLCLAKVDFSLLEISPTRHPLPASVSSATFVSHGPLI